MTANTIQKSQTGNNNATIALVEKFKPLLKKYASLLRYEDAYNDLLVDFIELLHNLRLDKMAHHNEGSIITYIQTSMRSSYIKRSTASRKYRNHMLFSDLSEKELYNVESKSSTVDTYFDQELSGLGALLTKAEFNILNSIYVNGHTSAEIALTNGTTRQAVNQMKKRALKKIEQVCI